METENHSIKWKKTQEMWKCIENTEKQKKHNVFILCCLCFSSFALLSPHKHLRWNGLMCHCVLFIHMQFIAINFDNKLVKVSPNKNTFCTLFNVQFECTRFVVRRTYAIAKHYYYDNDILSFSTMNIYSIRFVQFVRHIAYAMHTAG